MQTLKPYFNDVIDLPFLGKKFGGFFTRLCGKHWVDILWHLPTAVVHRPLVSNANDIQSGMIGTVLVQVVEHIKPRFQSQPYKIVCNFNNHIVELVFFNYQRAFIKNSLDVGGSYYISGKIERMGGIFTITHPDYAKKNLADIPVYEPIYPLTAGITHKVIAKAVQMITDKTPAPHEWIDDNHIKCHQLPDFKTALRLAHNPTSEGDLSPFSPARIRLAYDELLAHQLALRTIRQYQHHMQGIILPGNDEKEGGFIKTLPFALTGAQHRVISEINADLQSPNQMSRLLQGDVGAGKTIVAVMALLRCVHSGYQGVFMAPTDILARQHYEALTSICKNLDIEIILLTGREKGKKRQAILEKIATGTAHIIIGTHAVFTDDVIYHKLGIAIIDEQHKFGVHQRLALLQKQKGCNLLVMTATPIPRTLAITQYGEMDISILDEKPAGRRKIETVVLSVNKMDDIIEKLYQKINSSADKIQAYWVCPLIEESEKLDLIAAKQRFEILHATFKEKVALIHGKMKAGEKDAIMAQFTRGEIDVLVSTTVIEVGVDVKTASIMVIEEANRFGLAGLHQLRGRVGRGSQESQCILIYGTKVSNIAKQRLHVMRTSDDGFFIAEQDLSLRGAGEILGTRQSGLATFKIAQLPLHAKLLLQAQQDAISIIDKKAFLPTAKKTALNQLLYLFEKSTTTSTTMKAG